MVDRRSGILAALVAELDLHGSWFGTEYPKEVTPDDAWWSDPKRTVLKLGTFAVDQALSNAELFSDQTVVALTDYRQRVWAFNQLIQRAMLFQANAALWEENPSPALLERMQRLSAAVHWV